MALSSVFVGVRSSLRAVTSSEVSSIGRPRCHSNISAGETSGDDGTRLRCEESAEAMARHERGVRRMRLKIGIIAGSVEVVAERRKVISTEAVQCTQVLVQGNKRHNW